MTFDTDIGSPNINQEQVLVRVGDNLPVRTSDNTNWLFSVAFRAASRTVAV
jgi:hypothetical protein